MNQEQEKQQQILQAVVEALSQGVKPEEIAQVLVDKGMTQETAVQAIKMGMQYMQQNQQQGASDQFAQSMMGEQQSELPDYAYGAAAALLANPQVISSLISAAPAVMGMMNQEKKGYGGKKKYQDAGITSEDDKSLERFDEHMAKFKAYQNRFGNTSPSAIMGDVGEDYRNSIDSVRYYISDPNFQRLLEERQANQEMQQQMFGGSSPLNKFMGGGYSKKKKADLDKYQAGTFGTSSSGAPFASKSIVDANGMYDIDDDNDGNDAYNLIGGNNTAELALKDLYGIEDATPVSEDGTEIDYSKLDEAAERSKEFQNYNTSNLNAVNALKEKKDKKEKKQREDSRFKQFVKNYKMDQTDARLMLLKESKNPWMNIAKGLTGMYIGGKDMIGDAIEGRKARKLGKQARKEMKSSLSNAEGIANEKPDSPQTISMVDEKQDMYDYVQSQQPQTYTVDPNQQSPSVFTDTSIDMGTPVDIKPGPNNITDWSNMTFEEGGFTPHMMYDPVTNKAYFAKTEDDHNKFASLGYKHEDEMKKGGGYTVTRSNDRKGKTHKVVRNSDGKTEYYGHAMKNQPKNKKVKEAAEARHRAQGNFKNPFFKAYWDATWEDGGFTNDLGMYKSGGNVPTDPSKWSYYKGQAKEKFDVYPSAYANAWAAKKYKAAGGGWRKKEDGGYIEYEQGGSYDNPGFNALPQWVQNKIKSNAKYGGLPKFQGTTGSSTVGGGTNVSDINLDFSSLENQGYSSAREEDYGVAYGADGEIDRSETEDNFRRMYQPKVTEEQKQKDGSGAATFFWGWDMLNTGLEQRKERRRSERDQDKFAAMNFGNTMQESPIVEQSSRGVNLSNAGIGAQSFLDKHTPDNLGYGTFTGKYGGMKKYKQGGSLTNYKQGDEVFMTQEEIDQFIRMGGVVEIVKDNE